MRRLAPLLLVLLVPLLIWLLYDRSTRSPLSRPDAIEGSAVTGAGGEEVEAPPIAEAPRRTEGAPGVEPPSPDHFRVRVVDADGTPAPGVPVEIEVTKPFGRSTSLGSALADARGLALFDPSKFADREARLERSGFAPTFRALADLPCAEPIHAPIEGVPEAGEEVLLTLPPLAALTVEILDPEGARFSGEASLHMRWIPARLEGNTSYGGYYRYLDREPTTTTGIKRYSRIGLGILLSVDASAEGFVTAYVRDAPGPTEAGEEQRLTLRFAERRPFLRCRVLDDRGKPLANSALEAQVWDDPDGRGPSSRRRGTPIPFSVATDADGVADFPYGVAGTIAFDQRLDLTRRTPGLDPHDDPDWSSASLWLPRSRQGGVTYELGTAQLRAARILLEGRVVDALGAPLRGARLYFEHADPDADDDRWRQWSEGVLFSDDDGGFCLRGLRAPVTLRVSVSKRGHGTFVGADFAVAELGVVIQLPPLAEPGPTGSLLLSTLCDEGVPPFCFELVLRSASGQKQIIPLYGLAGEPVAVRHLPPGDASVTVRVVGVDAELLRHDELDIRADEELSDPRLLPLDLRGLARMEELRIVDPEGESLRRRRLYLAIPDLRVERRVRTDDEGQLAIPLPSTVTRIELSHGRERWIPVHLEISTTLREPVVLPAP